MTRILEQETPRERGFLHDTHALPVCALLLTTFESFCRQEMKGSLIKHLFVIFDVQSWGPHQYERDSLVER